VSSNILGISWQLVARKGAWEEILQNIKWNEPKMIRLDIFADNFKHQPYMRGRINMKEIINDD
jgi:hypothetical protein